MTNAFRSETLFTDADKSVGVNGELNGDINGDINGEINGEIKGEIKEEIKGDIKEEIKGDIKEEIKKVYVIVSSNEGIKAKDIAKQTNKSKKNIDKYLKILKDLKLITYKGSNKIGGYFKTT